jgi:SSS family solute:Na+ symporter
MAMGMTLKYLQLNNPGDAFTHTLNELRYYINCGIVVVILSAALLIVRAPKITLLAFLASTPLNLAIKYYVPDMNYFVRAGVVIVALFVIFQLLPGRNSFRPVKELFVADSKSAAWLGAGLALSLLVLHFVFH